MVNWFFGKDAKAIQQEKNRLLANGAGKTEYPHAEEWNEILICTLHTKISLNVLKT